MTAPVCSSSRSAMITGMYQTTIGAENHRSGRGVEKIHLPEGVTPIPLLFQKAGYYTCIGHGLPEGAAAGKQGKGPRLGKTDYNFEWDGKMYDGSDWSGRKPGQPFFMQVQLEGGKLRGNTEASAKQLSERAARELGSSTDPEHVTLPPYYPRDPVLLRDWAAYLDAVRLTDKHVGKVLERLEKEGVLDNTLVIFMTDHGISHAQGKQFLYNEGTHIPFVVCGPGVAKGAVRRYAHRAHRHGGDFVGRCGHLAAARYAGEDPLANDYQPREAVFAARDRCDETVDRIRSVRTDHYLYIRNFYPLRPLLQPNAYKDGKSILQSLRALHEAGQLGDLSEKLLFSATRPAEELYEWTTDPWQVNNLAEDPAHRETLVALRSLLDRWMSETHDAGPESEAMYDSDMAKYSGDGDSRIKKNIKLMKQWAAEGK